MSGKDYDILIQKLLDDGWKKSGMTIRREDFHFYKAYEEYKDKYGETCHRYQILVLFYDWRKYGESAFAGIEEQETSVSVVVMPLDLEDIINVDLEISHFEGITKVERIAKEYYEWVRRNFKCLDR